MGYGLSQVTQSRCGGRREIESAIATPPRLSLSRHQPGAAKREHVVDMDHGVRSGLAGRYNPGTVHV
eukprot:2217725-Prymnesium_polylepis.2